MSTRNRLFQLVSTLAVLSTLAILGMLWLASGPARVNVQRERDKALTELPALLEQSDAFANRIKNDNPPSAAEWHEERKRLEAITATLEKKEASPKLSEAYLRLYQEEIFRANGAGSESGDRWLQRAEDILGHAQAKMPLRDYKTRMSYILSQRARNQGQLRHNDAGMSYIQQALQLVPGSHFEGRMEEATMRNIYVGFLLKAGNNQEADEQRKEMINVQKLLRK